MTTAGWLVVGWIAGILATGAGLVVWALIEDRCRSEQPWWEEETW